MSIAASIDKAETQRYRVTGIDCPSCARKIEKAVRSVGVKNVKVSTATQIMTLRVDDPAKRLPAVERAVTGIGYRLDSLDNPAVDSGGDIDDLPKDLVHITPAYRRALWTVILLNISYGVVEAIGGFISGSQALKADALDFLGDGLITFLGILAIGWSLAWRARSALAQGLFLGALGLGVLANTTYRILVQQQPDAQLMGLFAVIALVVNLIAVLPLLPHREGDANVRAVWLFSRNDAIGNATVVVAAGIVAWTGTAWPDLAVAIAGLFLHSSWSIIRDAWADLWVAK